MSFQYKFRLVLWWGYKWGAGMRGALVWPKVKCFLFLKCWTQKLYFIYSKMSCPNLSHFPSICTYYYTGPVRRVLGGHSLKQKEAHTCIRTIAKPQNYIHHYAQLPICLWCLQRCFLQCFLMSFNLQHGRRRSQTQGQHIFPQSGSLGLVDLRQTGVAIQRHVGHFWGARPQ